MSPGWGWVEVGRAVHGTLYSVDWTWKRSEGRDASSDSSASIRKRSTTCRAGADGVAGGAHGVAGAPTHPHAPPTSHPRGRARACRPPARQPTSRGAAAAAVAAAARRAPSRRRGAGCRAGHVRLQAGQVRLWAGQVGLQAGRRTHSWSFSSSECSEAKASNSTSAWLCAGHGAPACGVRRAAACGWRGVTRRSGSRGLQRRGAEDAEGAECRARQGCRAGVRRRARRARRLPGPGAEAAGAGRGGCAARLPHAVHLGAVAAAAQPVLVHLHLHQRRRLDPRPWRLVQRVGHRVGRRVGRAGLVPRPLLRRSAARRRASVGPLGGRRAAATAAAWRLERLVRGRPTDEPLAVRVDVPPLAAGAGTARLHLPYACPVPVL